MSFWVYKCNDTDHPDQVVHGDWEHVSGARKPVEWGSTEYSSDLKKLAIGDLLIAYQTERNEVVGLAEVVQFKPFGQYQRLYVQAVERFGVLLRPLKKIDARIRAMDAFKAGPIRTIYPITTSEAWHLIAVIKAQRQLQTLCVAKPRK